MRLECAEPSSRGRARWRGTSSRAAVAILLVAATALPGFLDPGGPGPSPGSQDPTLAIPSVRGKPLDEAEQIMGSNFGLVVGGTENSRRPEGAGSGKLDKSIKKLEKKKDKLEKKRDGLRDRKS